MTTSLIGATHPLGDRPATGARRLQRLMRPDAPARLAPGRPELAALIIREQQHTLRLALCAVAAVLAVTCLIPIANARPRWRGASPDAGESGPEVNKQG